MGYRSVHATAILDLLQASGVEEMLQDFNEAIFNGNGTIQAVYQDTQHTYPRKYTRIKTRRDIDHTTSSLFSVREHETPFAIPFPLYGLALEGKEQSGTEQKNTHFSLFVGFSHSYYHGSLFGVAEGLGELQPDGNWDKQAIRTMQAVKLSDPQLQAVFSPYIPLIPNKNLKFPDKSVLEVINTTNFSQIAKGIGQSRITTILNSISIRK